MLAPPAQYLVDEKGSKTAVLLPLHVYQQLIKKIRDLTAVTEQPQEEPPALKGIIPSSMLVDKAMLREQMESLFETLDIQGEPIGAIALQEEMRQANLDRNELSQSIIAMREE